jgi:hypothetical protein
MYIDAFYCEYLILAAGVEKRIEVLERLELQRISAMSGKKRGGRGAFGW